MMKQLFFIFLLLMGFILNLVASDDEVFLKLDTKGHTGLIWDIIVTKSGDIISASDDKTIRVWDSATGVEKRKILGEIGIGSEGMIFAMALSPNEEFLAVGGYFDNITAKENENHGRIRIYNYSTGKLLKNLKSHTSVVHDLSFSSDGKYLISGSADKTAKIWNIERDFRLVDTISFHTNHVYAVKIIKSRSDYFAVTAGYDNEIALYNMQTKKIVNSHQLGYKLKYLATSKDNIAVCGFGQEIKIYNYKLNPIQTIESETQPYGLTYSPNGKLLIAGTGDFPNNINIYNVNHNYKKIQSFKKHTNTTMAVAFLDNQTAVSGGGDNKEIYIWNIKRVDDFKKIEGVGDTVWSIGVKGESIAWGNKANNVQYLNNRAKLQKSINLKTFQISGHGVNSMFHKVSTTYKNYQLNHRRGGDYNNADGILDIKKDGKIEASIVRGGTNGLSYRCYGFYKNYIVSGGSNGQLKIYNLKGEEVANLVGHTGEVWSIALDGDRLVSGSDDQTIKIWDLSTLEKKEINYELLARYQLELERESKEKWNILSVANVLDKSNINYYIKEIYSQLNLFISKNNEWIAWTPEGYFNASKKGIDYIYFHLNQGSNKEAKAIPLKQLYDHFFRPDLIKLKLAGEEDAYKEAVGNLDFHVALDNPPPDVKIMKIDKKKVSSKSQTIETNKNSIELAYNITDNKGGVGLIRVYQEGKLIQTIGDGRVNRDPANKDTTVEQSHDDEKNIEEEKEKDSKARNVASDPNRGVGKDTVQSVKITMTTTNYAGEQKPLTIPLKAGKNEITIEVFNKTNTVASFRDSVVVNAHIPIRKPKLYAIVAGVNKFVFPDVDNLKYSVNDANAIKEAVETKMKKVFDNVEVHYLIDENVTTVKLNKEIENIRKNAHLEDTVLFYISTHGRAGEDGRMYLYPHNNDDDENYIDFEKTFNQIQSIKALNQIFVVDACESGKANDIVSAVYDARASVLARSAGVHMLLATTRGASAFESKDPNVKNGVFTHRILEALKNKNTNKNNDKFISVIEVSDEVRATSGKIEKQYPVIRNVGGDVELERVE